MSSNSAGLKPVAGPQLLRSLRVLVVDDNRVNQLLLSSMLGRIGHQVDVASSGAEAIERLMQADYDLVLMDYLMPGLDGFATTRKIRQLEGAAGCTPIIGVSADVDGTADDRPAACGMNASVAKPILRDALLRVIDSCLPTPAHTYQGEQP